MKLNCWKGRFIAVRIKKTILHLALFVVLELKFSAERRGIIRIRYLTLWVWLGLVAYNAWRRKKRGVAGGGRGYGIQDVT